MIIENTQKRLYTPNFKLPGGKIARVRLLPGQNKVDDELYSHLKDHPVFVVRLAEGQIKLIDNKDALKDSHKRMNDAVAEHKAKAPGFDKAITEAKKANKTKEDRAKAKEDKPANVAVA